MDSKSTHLHFFNMLPIQSAFGSNNQDLCQKFRNLTTRQNTSLILVTLFHVSVSISLQVLTFSLGLGDSDQATVSHTVWDLESLSLWWLSRGSLRIVGDSWVTLAPWRRAQHLRNLVIRRSPIRFRPKIRQLRFTWIWANRPSSKGSKLLFPVIKAI